LGSDGYLVKAIDTVKLGRVTRSNNSHGSNNVS